MTQRFPFLSHRTVAQVWADRLCHLLAEDTVRRLNPSEQRELEDLWKTAHAR